MSNKASKSALQGKVNYFINNKNDTECLIEIISSFKVRNKKNDIMTFFYMRVYNHF